MSEEVLFEQVEVRNSPISGLGLFAAKPLKAGSICFCKDIDFYEKMTRVNDGAFPNWKILVSSRYSEEEEDAAWTNT